ncbi:hypothetical protein VOLCADRAFT_89954 [Volvox carteri f. nagariensis]|uniref:AP2/ERF domain-containing protein n=1 Tax=Volvox carteri f. nagariensis TaxID=3068 RepID=D8TT37_VOLCA|nr:uncharacterized protein VOLCADRAFT_89954 [Volvox carteri f. nagariensis]EFJ49125.1 hypothetical protein VOLCADRAFT_89954 [Volvox carteri f. nagariensis]|eukprot:XP_002949573.1 hypothetical protein VOLCADRAFT_89954 [Volvox carteri f. nagariensis]
MAYKLFGTAAVLNYDLPAERRAELDAMSMEDLMASFRAQGERFARGRSQFRGVSWHKGSAKWHANIWTGDGKQKCLGYFSSEEAAALAYDAAARKAFGTAAKLNFPHGEPQRGGSAVAPAPHTAATDAAGGSAAAAPSAGGISARGGDPSAALGPPAAAANTAAAGAASQESLTAPPQAIRKRPIMRNAKKSAAATATESETACRTAAAAAAAAAGPSSSPSTAVIPAADAATATAAPAAAAAAAAILGRSEPPVGSAAEAFQDSTTVGTATVGTGVDVDVEEGEEEGGEEEGGASGSEYADTGEEEVSGSGGTSGDQDDAYGTDEYEYEYEYDEAEPISPCTVQALQAVQLPGWEHLTRSDVAS